MKESVYSIGFGCFHFLSYPIKQFDKGAIQRTKANTLDSKYTVSQNLPLESEALAKYSVISEKLVM